MIRPHEFRDGFFIFFILYIHLQFQRFLILPYFIAHRYALYSVLSLATVCLFGTLAYLIDSWLSTVGWYDEAVVKHSQLYLYYVLCCLVSLIILLFIFFIVEYYKQQNRDTDNQILLKEMEMNLLRSQLNPHFLFNSLNNLYGISLEKPEEVPEKIMHMASIMRYYLELSGRKYVSLQEDLNFIRDYITIEADRVTERCTVKLSCMPEDSALQSYTIAPMILICFVENAFKHYVAPVPGAKGFIQIEFRMEESVLQLRIRNSSAPNSTHLTSTKVGIANTKKRLNILYPGKHLLRIVDEESFYEVQLNINMD